MLIFSKDLGELVLGLYLLSILRTFYAGFWINGGEIMMRYCSEMQRIREEIDRIDNIVMSLLDKRRDLALEIGRIKKICNLPVYQNGREEEILEKAERIRYGEIMRNIYSVIMEESKKVQIGNI